KSQHKLAEMYGIGKTQVRCILKRKTEFIITFEQNEGSVRKRFHAAFCYEDVDDLTWQWFQQMCSKRTIIRGIIIQEQARKFAMALNNEGFKASNGLLNRFKARHNINCSIILGEKCSVDPVIAQDYKVRIPELTCGYKPEDVYNMDESSVIFCVLPSRTLAIHGEECANSTKSKDCITMSVCCNMDGNFETSIFTGSSKPRCFKNYVLDSLPLMLTNKKAWVTSAIFMEWVQKMRTASRHVLLFLDNSPVHPHELPHLSKSYMFLPASTSSVLQPLDQGIIQNIKMHYKKRLL
uniref:HTH CENPB-type domain-containing protein n=1 Tax=Latimeria chalumnae TaxID=7897 RepID=H2ZUK4_LATCH